MEIVAMGKRKGISKKSRFEIFKRDQFTCQYCGSKPPNIVLELDHILAVASGGGNESHNLITSCFDCNRGKSDRSIAQVPIAIEASLQEQIERKEQLEEYNRYLIEIRNRETNCIKEIGVHWFNQYGPESERDQYTFGSGRMCSMRTFINRLTIVEIYDAIEISFSRMRVYNDNDDKVWKYFCAVCWNKIKGAQNG